MSGWNEWTMNEWMDWMNELMNKRWMNGMNE